MSGYLATAKAQALLFTNVAVGATFALVGAGSQRWGRRRVITLAALLGGSAGEVLYFLLAAGPSSIVTTLLLTVATQITVLAVWGAATSYCNERFPTAVRSTGFGIGYSLAVVVPSFYAVYMAALSQVMPYRYTQLVLLACGIVLAVLGARWGPETVQVDLRELRSN